MALTSPQHQAVATAADAWARAHRFQDAASVPFGRAGELVGAVAAQTGLAAAEVRDALMGGAVDHNAAAADAHEALGLAGGSAAARDHRPLVDDAHMSPMGARLANQPGPVPTLQRMDLRFRLDDVAATRVVVTAGAGPKVLAEVAAAAKKLVKLVDELEDAPPGADTGQAMEELERLYKGLSSRAAGGRGIFLSKAGAQVAMPGAPATPEAAAPRDAARSAGRLSTAVAVGVDPHSGEKVVLQPMGRVVEELSIPGFVARYAQRARRDDAVTVLAGDAAAVAALRTLSDVELDAKGLRDPKGPTEYVTITGELQGHVTYATRWYKEPRDIFARRIVTEGPFRGVFLDDVASHVDEASTAAALKDSRLKWLSPSKSLLMPVMTTVQVKQGGEPKTLLRIRIPSTRDWTAVRQSLAKLSAQLPDVKQLPGSKSTIFVFDPSAFTFVRKIAQSFAPSVEAQRLVDGRVRDLLKFEKALTPEAIAKYSADQIGGFRARVVDREGRTRPFEFSEVQKSTLARVDMDGLRGAITLGMGMGKTLVAIAALQLATKQGEQRPYLVVVPEGLEGGFPAEIHAKLLPAAAAALDDRTVVMTYKDFRRAVRTGKHEGKAFTAKKFGAVVYDEAHLVTDRRSATGAAVLAFGHPRTMELTGTPQTEPERLQTMDAAVKGVDLNKPDAKADRKQARDWRKLNFNEVNGICVGVKGPFELKRGLQIDPTREMLEVMRTRFIYADSFDDDVVLPKRTDVHVALTMSPTIEKEYRSTARPARIAMEGLVSIYRDDGLMVGDNGAPKTFKGRDGKERTRITRQAKDPRVHDVRSKLKPVIGELSTLTNTAEKLKHTGKKLLELMHEDELRGAPASRSLLFTDDREYVTQSALELSRQIPVKLHAACVGDAIRVFQNGVELKQLGPFALPFREQAYRADPTRPANDGANRETSAEAWRTFALDLLGKHGEVGTTTLFGPVYQAGQNLQWANVVVHLDRDTWSDFNMRQREARSHRRGQSRPVTVMHVDYVFAKPKSNVDRTLDEVRALHAGNDRELLKGTLQAAQKIQLGEGLHPAREDDAFDSSVNPTKRDMSYFAAGAEPTARTIGEAAG